MKMIYNTEGTGISHRQIHRLETTQPGAGTYLGADMSDGHPLGDEIMLLDGMDDLQSDALAGLGFVRSGNYVSRGYDMSEFTLGAGELPSTRRAGRDFEPFGLGAGGRAHPRGRKAGRDFEPYALGASHVMARAREVTRFGARKRARPDLFIGPNFYPLGQHQYGPKGERLESLSTSPVTYPDTPGPETFFAAAIAGNTEPYEQWKQTPHPGTWLSGGLGDAAGDRRAAIATATLARTACTTGCNVADMAANDRRRCLAVCTGLYDGAMAAINGALPPPGVTPTADPALMEAKLRALEAGADQAQAGQIPTGDTGMSTTTMVLIGGAALLGVGLIVVLARR